MTTNTIRQARTQLRLYTRNSRDFFLQPHVEAMECRDCEDLLELGIFAFRCLEKAEQRWKEGVEAGLLPFDPQQVSHFLGWFESWLPPCDLVEQWINVHQVRGYTIEHLDEFRVCCEKARDKVEQGRWAQLSTDVLAGSSEEW